MSATVVPRHLTAGEYESLRELGRRLEAARLRCGLSRATVCIAVNCSERGLQNWEHAERTINLLDFLKLCKLYGISPDDFLDIIPQPWEVSGGEDYARAAS